MAMVAIQPCGRLCGAAQASIRAANSSAKLKEWHRSALPSPHLRYGRFYFRPISGDEKSFAVSGFTPGVVAFSRILNDQEVLVAANTHTSQPASFDAIVEIQLSSEGDQFQVLYSNQTTATPPQPVRSVVSVAVQEVDAPPVSVRCTLCI
jgi:hypothetical protein